LAEKTKFIVMRDENGEATPALMKPAAAQRKVCRQERARLSTHKRTDL
jgi:hypothetical protein